MFFNNTDHERRCRYGTNEPQKVNKLFGPALRPIHWRNVVLNRAKFNSPQIKTVAKFWSYKNFFTNKCTRIKNWMKIRRLKSVYGFGFLYDGYEAPQNVVYNGKEIMMKPGHSSVQRTNFLTTYVWVVTNEILFRRPERFPNLFCFVYDLST